MPEETTAPQARKLLHDLSNDLATAAALLELSIRDLASPEPHPERVQEDLSRALTSIYRGAQTIQHIRAAVLNPQA